MRFGRIIAVVGLALALRTATAQAQAGAWQDPSPHRVVQVTVEPGVRLEVLDWGGTGVPMLFIPGLGNTAHSYDTFAPRFRDAYHVYAITPRGFGASSHPAGGYDSGTRVRDVLTVLDSLGIERAILIGHSIAGDLLSHLGADHPTRVRALVYLDAYSYGTDSFQSDLPQAQSPPPPRMTSADSASLESVTAYISRNAGREILQAEVYAISTYSPSGRLLVLGRPDASEKVRSGARRSEFARISAPALAIYARRVVPQQNFPRYHEFDEQNRLRADARFAAHQEWQRKQIDRFRSEAQRGVVLEIPGANHYVHYSNAKEVEQAIRDFLRRI
jgi:non-heme chloroperoxidase